MPIIGEAEIQILASAPNFAARLQRELAPGLATMNRQVETAIDKSAREFDTLGSTAIKSLAKIGDAPGLKNLVTEAGNTADKVEQTITRAMQGIAKDSVRAFDGTGDRITAELVIDGDVVTRDLLDAGDRAARQLPDQFTNLDRDIGRQVDGDVVFQGLTDAGGRAADRMPGEFVGTGTDIARIIDREVDAANLSTDVQAAVQVDRGRVAADVAAAVGSAEVPVRVDTGGIAADVTAAVAGARGAVTVDQADLTRQIDRGIERAGDVPLNLTHLTEQVRRAVQQGVTAGDVSVDVNTGRATSPLGGLGDTGIIRDFSVAAAADRLDDSVGGIAGPARAVVDSRAVSEGIARGVASGSISGIRVSAPRVAEEIERVVEATTITPKLDQRAIADAWAGSDRVRLLVDQALVASQVKEAVEAVPVVPQLDQRAIADQWVQSDRVRGVVDRAAEAVKVTPERPDARRSILGADDRAAIKITPDYTEVARELERVVDQADIKLPVDWDGLRNEAERELAQADIKLPSIEPEVRRSILEGVEKADVGNIKIGVDPIGLARDMEKAVKGAGDEPIKIRVDFDRLGDDIRKLKNQADIKIGVDVETKEITAAERAFDLFRTKLAASTDVEFDVDYTQIREAFDIADRLDKLVAEVDVTTDVSQLDEAYRLAKALEGFAAQIDLRTDGLGELQDALRITDALERIATVSIAVKGADDLREAGRLADNLEKTRTVPIDARAEDLIRLEDKIGSAGEEGAAKVESALGDIDFGDIGGSALDQMTGALAELGPWAAVAASVGAVFGDEFMAGFSDRFNQGTTNVVLQLRYNLDDADLGEIGRAGGAAYGGGLAEGLTSAKEAAAILKGELSDVDKSLDLTEATKQALALEKLYGIDVAESVATVDNLLSQHLVKSAEEGYNLLGDLGQQVGRIKFPEAIESANEFSNAFSALGIEGPQGIYLMGEALRLKLFPQLDQAGESFEEFNEIVSTGQAADALTQIGLNAQEMQRKIAGGGPEAAKATREIAEALIAIDDPGQRAAATAAIFGSNVSRISNENKDLYLGLLATADGSRQVSSSMSDAADKLEGTVTGFDRLKQLATGLGSELAVLPGSLASFISGDWRSGLEDMRGLLADIVNPLDVVGRAFGKDWDFGPITDATNWIRGIGDAADESEPKVKRHAETIEKTGKAGEVAADGLSEAEKAVKDLDDALSEFSSRFDADAEMRKLTEDTEAALESVKDLTGAAYDLGTGFDTSTEAGRNAQSAMEDLSGNLDNLIGLYQDGKIDSDQLSAGQRNIEATLRAVASQMGLTEAEADDLVRKYGTIPDDVYTNLHAIDYASPVVKNLQTSLGLLQDKTITLTTVQRTQIQNSIISATAATAGKRAGGGHTRGLTLVGEKGPELADFTGAAFIYNAAQTEALLSSGAVRAYALGGLADKPSIFGEDGLELALPLTKPDRLRALLRDHGGLLIDAAGGPSALGELLYASNNRKTATTVDQALAGISLRSAPTGPLNAPPTLDLGRAESPGQRDGTPVAALLAAVAAAERSTQMLGDAITAVQAAAGLAPRVTNVYPARGEDWWPQMALADQLVR